MPISAVPATQAPTHVGAFRQPVTSTPVLAPAAATAPFTVTIEAAWGANLALDPSGWTWSDISADARVSDGVTIGRGRPDEGSQTTPTSAQFTLNNFNGQYTPRNAMGANYPYVRQNTPFRISINDGTENSIRGIVYADSYTPGWDPSLNLPTVHVSASGILRRLGQGATPLHSAIYRATVTASPQPLGYWEMADGSDVRQLACTLPAGGPTIRGSVDIYGNPDPRWGQGELAPWLPNGVDFKGASGILRPMSMPAGWVIATGWSVDCIVNVGSDRGTNLDSEPILYVTGAGPGITNDWDIEMQPAGINPTDQLQLIFFQVQADLSSSSATILGTVTNKALWDNKPHHVRLSVNQSGANIAWSVAIDGVASISGTVLGQTLQAPAQAEPFSQALNTWPKYVFGDLTLWSTSAPPATAAAALGYVGESASTRLVRLCGEQGIPVVASGSSNSAMGPQTLQAFLPLLRECESVDGGILTDGRTGGFAFLASGARYNRAPDLALDMALGQLPPGFAPVEDDQRRRNDWTVSRVNGATVAFTDVDGPQGINAVGAYTDSTTLNVNADTDLINQAAWRVHLGTVEAMRYPTVPLNLRANPELAVQWRGCDIGSRFTLRNLPSQHQPGDVDLIIEGYTEFCDGQQWTVGINSSPFDPWWAFVIGDPVLGKIDTDGSILASSLAALAQGTVDSFTVNVMAGQLWTTTVSMPADFPFDINVDGERITVTGISGVSSPQTFTVKRAINGVVKAHQVGATVGLWIRPVPAL